MQIKSLTLQNFRRYSNAVTIEFENLTAFVGKNDVGKSSILEALDIFFNDGRGCIKLDKDDINKIEASCGNNEISIAVCFENLPDTVVIDATNETTLESEYLLNESRQLEIVKKYPNAGSAKVYIRAYHPTNPNCSDLLLKKDSELRRILSSQSITCADQTRNAVMRKAIWEYYSDDLRFATTDIDVTKNDASLIVGNNSVSVAYGVDDETLESTPGWLETSAMPGEEETCVIFGHRNRNHLKLLKDVKLGDTIKIKSQGIEYSYIIESISILENDAQLTIPAATGKHLLISTCYPFYYSGSAPQKFVLWGKMK